MQKFVEKFRVDYINVMGDEAVVKPFSSIPGIGAIQGIPVTFVIDRKGQNCRRFVGLTEKRVLEEAIDRSFRKGHDLDHFYGNP